MMKHCDNTEEHNGHTFPGKAEVRCPGKTDCGQWSHPAHTFIEDVEYYCVGVCNCGLRGSHHGPGDHK